MAAHQRISPRTEPWPWRRIWRGFLLAFNHGGAGGHGGHDGRHMTWWTYRVWLKWRLREAWGYRVERFGELGQVLVFPATGIPDRATIDRIKWAEGLYGQGEGAVESLATPTGL
jgi:hypothetical protein